MILITYIDITNFLVNGNWGTWGSYSLCSVTCGDGTKSRTRSCSNPTPFGGGSDCSGSSSQSANCNNGACPGEIKIFGHCLYPNQEEQES